MVYLTLDMPADLQRWMDARVAQHGYRDTADYLRELVERERAEHEADVARVRRLVQEADDSELLEEEPEEVLRQIRARVLGLHG